MVIISLQGDQNLGSGHGDKVGDYLEQVNVHAIWYME